MTLYDWPCRRTLRAEAGGDKVTQDARTSTKMLYHSPPSFLAVLFSGGHNLTEGSGSDGSADKIERGTAAGVLWTATGTPPMARAEQKRKK